MTHTPTTYDAIVVGGGHHGLVSGPDCATSAEQAGRGVSGMRVVDVESARRSPRPLLGRRAR